MNEYRELLIGCGHSREKRVLPPSREPGSASAEYVRTHFRNLSTLDINPDTGADLICDLRQPPYRYLTSNEYDEIHAYEVLEHIGPQGDAELFFAQFAEFWRILKPGGYLCATVPDWRSRWAWGDPGHTRVISACTLVFLDQIEYSRQLGHTAMSDYRSLLRDTNFRTVHAQSIGDTFQFVLQAEKHA